MTSKKRVACPVCGEMFHLHQWLKKGAQLLCPYCEEMLEVVNLKPIEVDCVSSPGGLYGEELDWDVGVWQNKESRQH